MSRNAQVISLCVVNMEDRIMSETKERKTDRRVEKTKQAMRHAFVELLKRKPYNAITISELTREADIDRRTFYLHYESIEDLVKEMQKIARDAITEQLKQRRGCAVRYSL